MKNIARQTWLAAAIFGGLATILWWEPLFGHRALFYDVIYRLFYPNAEFLRRCLQARRFPFWNPDLYCGVPFLANLQSALFYPPTYLYAWLDYATALAANCWLHTVLAAAFMYLAARELEVCHAAALLGGIVFGFNANAVMHYSYPSNMQSYVWLPLIVFFILRARRGVAGALPAAAAAAALQIFAGHPQFALYSALALTLHAAFQPERPAALRLLTALGALCFCLAAVQLVPSLCFAVESVRNSAADARWALSYSIALKDFLIMLLAPQWRGFFQPGGGDPHLIGFYFGPFTLLAAGLAFRGERRRWAPYAAIVLAGTLLCWGRHSPLYRLLYEHVPPFNWFRFPAQALYLVCFGVSALAALGADRLPPRLRSTVCLLCALDLLIFAKGCLITIDPAVYAARTPIADFLSHRSWGRVFLTPRTRNTLGMTGRSETDGWLKFKDVLTPDLGMVYGLPMADGGAEPLYFRRYDAVLNELDQDPLSPWMDLLGIRYILTFWDLPRTKFRLIGTTTARIFENPAARPAVYLAAAADFVPEARTLDYLRSPGSARAGHILVHDPALARPAESPDPAERVETLAEAPGRLSVRVSRARPGWLVSTQAWDAGWRAAINGLRVPVRRVNLVQSAVEVPAGQSQVEFDYRPPGFGWALALSLLAWLWTLRRLWAGRRPVT
jgi:hypothetical protein